MNAHPRPRTLFEDWKMRSLMVMLGVAALSSTARADGKARLNAEASLLGGVFRTTHIGFETTVRVEPSIGVRGVLGIQLDRRGTTFRLGGVLDVVSVGDAEPLALGGELQVDHLVSEHWRLGGRVSVSAADNSNALVAVGPRARALDHIVAGVDLVALTRGPMTWFGAEVNVGLADCRPTYILAASGIGAVVLAAVFVIGMSAGRPG